MRLTEKDFTQKDYDIHEYDYQESVNKLGRLEDIEDELGIDLITFMKVRYAYFHDKQICFRKKTISFGRIHYLGEKGIFVMYYNSRTTNYSTITLKYKDYGQTWALTKEELKENKN